MKQPIQASLFKHVLEAYGAAGGVLDNASLYREVGARADIPESELDRTEPIGRACAARSPVKRQIRWYQQTLKQMGLLERTPGTRGEWRLTIEGGKKLTPAPADVCLLGFSTHLGVAIWGRAENAFSGFTEKIYLVVTSPPYPLRRPRAYGNVTEAEYVDFICRCLEPVVRSLAAGASVCLNVSNDIFQERAAARSLYRERLVIALHDRLGLHKMDEIPWINFSKPPGPAYWASIERKQLNVAWEPIYWLTNDPSCVNADNRRVLQPHTEKHLRLIQHGGENRHKDNSDGAYKLRRGAYSAPTAGRIPRNVIMRGHACAEQAAYKRAARALGLPVHGAPMPFEIANFLIRFLTEPGQLVADPFAGSMTTADAAERLGRPWFATEMMYEYIRGGAERFRGREGFELSLPDFQLAQARCA
jgi:site-specific DNA-methyltransferase (cytosine-N4-specific)